MAFEFIFISALLIILFLDKSSDKIRLITFYGQKDSVDLGNGSGNNGRTQGGGGKGATYAERTDGFCDGTANTGGGGGGRSFSVHPSGGGDGGSGGSGIVVLRMATGIYTGTTTGSPTVTTDGTDTVLKFTGSGSYTA